MRVVGVHGVGNYRPSATSTQAGAQLAAIWSRALARGFSQPVDLTVAYYADHLQPRGRQGADDELPPEARELLEAWLAQLDVPPAVTQGNATRPFRQILGWIAERRQLAPRLVELFVTTFFREVARYLRGDGVRQTIRDTVAATIRAHQPSVVLAHSLGSIVTYETLWHHGDLEVDLLVTLGSPLAMPHVVFPRLDPAPVAGRGSRPPNVKRWVNIADAGDLVAIPSGGIPMRFIDLAADHTAAIHAFDFHLAANYLACTPLAAELAAHR
ncbi:hypothetical protein AB0883_21160 [Micromonospora sp. NPDC047812]|uniref:hypothetical protein n=1 Tax=Micromonospora sp. NPDC047812 TaxID=3155742 RepID=UPI003453DB1E